MTKRIKTADRGTLEEIAKRYDTRVDFDGVIARFAGHLIAERVAGLRVLECGAASGEMTDILLGSASAVDIVEAAEHYIKVLSERFGSRVSVHATMLEDFVPSAPYDAVVMAGLLHHLADPGGVLRKARAWVKPGGQVFITVPNMLSMHRRLGVAMKLMEHTHGTSKRNEFFHQPGRFDRGALEKLIVSAGWAIIELSGFLIKPFPHAIMEQFSLPPDLLEGLCELGRQFPDLASQIFLVAEPAGVAGDLAS